MSRTKADTLTNMFKDYIWECFRRMGKHITHCDQCGKKLVIPYIHHTKYEGATIHDLQVVCESCNMKGENQGLK